LVMEAMAQMVDEVNRELAETISCEQHVEAMEKPDIYKDWLLEHIIQPTKRNALVVLPITSQEVDHREDAPT
jgi:hypothetical protein